MVRPGPTSDPRYSGPEPVAPPRGRPTARTPIAACVDAVQGRTCSDRHRRAAGNDLAHPRRDAALRQLALVQGEDARVLVLVLDLHAALFDGLIHSFIQL